MDQSEVVVVVGDRGYAQSERRLCFFIIPLSLPMTYNKKNFLTTCKLSVLKERNDAWKNELGFIRSKCKRVVVGAHCTT